MGNAGSFIFDGARLMRVRLLSSWRCAHFDLAHATLTVCACQIALVVVQF